MSDPVVCAIMLMNGRAEMARKAVDSFKTQTYANKRLLVWDTGELNAYFETEDELVGHVPAEAYREPRPTIGKLRNEANAFWNSFPILCHWDSDDWSHPRRIEEQVVLLQASGKGCVGYRELLFWDQRPIQANSARPDLNNWPRREAWLYRQDEPTMVIGTSMMYWRAAWEACPFVNAPHEDYRWYLANARKCVGVTSLVGGEPRMIARIHGANTETIHPKESIASPWRRAAKYDSYCAERMAL